MIRYPEVNLVPPFVAGGIEHIVSPHVVGYNAQNRILAVADERVSYLRLQGLDVDDGVGRSEIVIEIAGVQRPEVRTLASFDIENGYELTFLDIETTTVGGRYPVADYCLSCHRVLLRR
jgi:hypothetical protein